MEEKKLNKLKNKKKDIIIAGTDEANRDAFSKQEIKTETTKEKQENKLEQSKIKDSSIELNKENIQMFDKIIFQIQLLFSMCDKLDEKLSLALTKFLSPTHLAAILEERDCQFLCGNFTCGRKIKKDSVKSYYNPKTDKVHIDDILEMFCDVKCFQKFKDYSKIVEKFDYFIFLDLESLFLLSNVKDFYPNNEYLSKISTLSNKVIEKFIRSQSVPNLEGIFKSYRLNLCKYFIEDFDKFITTDEFKENLELNLIF